MYVRIKIFMKIKNKLCVRFFLFLFIQGSSLGVFCYENDLETKKALLAEKIETCMIASAWGDVLGGVTEFHATQSQLFSYHPAGTLSIDDLTNTDWSKFPAWYFEKRIAPYTDDTAMALVLADYCIQSNGAKLFDDSWMAGLASEFIAEMNNSYGWKAPFRAPGLSTIKALELLSKSKKTEWPLFYKKFEDHQGCGSIMRAYPCGLLFWNNLEDVKNAAVAQSRVTHNSTIANGSCAAFAAGVALLLQQLNNGIRLSNRMIHALWMNKMIEVADEIDKSGLVSEKIYRASEAGREMESLLIKYKIRSPKKLIRELKNEKSEIGQYHFDICNKFPGWKADDALAAAVYCVSVCVEQPYLGIILGVHSTGDSDSIACLAGAIIGAWHGKNALPVIVWEKEVPCIEGIDTIKAYAKKIYELSCCYLL